jgi:hypothetical protein
MEAWYSKEVNKSGKRSLTWNRSKSNDESVIISCGNCIGCRLERSRQWAIRITREAELHPVNCFITLSYNNEHLPKNGSLDKTIFPKFMKRLRRKYDGRTIRYFHCGEYGESTFRPHYHACLFNFDFPDKVYHKKTVKGSHLYRSKILDQLWTDPKTGKSLGYAWIGELNFDSAAYVARYIVKKQSDKLSKETLKYSIIDKSTGEYLGEKEKEFITMSRGRRPDGGIGFRWYEKWKDKIYEIDTMSMKGKPTKPPKRFDKWLEEEDPERFEDIKFNRGKEKLLLTKDDSPERLLVREKCAEAKLNTFRERSYNGKEEE